MDMQEILSQVITSTNDIFEAEAGSVAMLESSGQQIVIRAAVGAGADRVRGLSLPVSQGIIGWVASHEEPALVPDVAQDDRFYREIDQESGFHTRSIMCVPMQAGGHTIGVIELMNMRPDYLSDSGLKMLSVIADHAALALENARLLAETRQRAEEQALLFEAMAIVTSDLALETVLDAVSRQMVEALKSDLCLISRWEREGNQLQLMQHYIGPGVSRPEKVTRQPDDSPLLLSLVESQISRILESRNTGISPEEMKWLEELQVEALLLIPLIYHRQTIGLVEIGRLKAVGPLTQGELRLAETMTAQAAVAIEHARLYDEATRRLAEARVLQEVMVAAASTLDFDQVLNGTIQALHRTLGIERLGFFLPTPEGTTVVAHPTLIGFDQQAGHLRIPMAGSAVGWVLHAGKPLLVPDVRQADDYYELAADTLTQMCVPVLVGGSVAAVLNAESPRLNAFDQDDLRLFRAVAAELAVALQNARLFEEVRTAEANYRDLFDNANDFILTLDNNFRISRVNKVALKTTGYRFEEIIGARAAQFISPQQLPKLYKLLKARLALSAQPPAPFEMTILGKERQEVLLEVTLRVQRAGRRPVSLHCIARDITHRRELEQQLQQTEKLSTIGKLVAGVAHELNNPLTTVLGYANLLQKSDLSPAHQADLDIIFRQTERASIIVRDLLTFARKFDLNLEPVDLNESVNTSLSLMKSHLRSHAIQVVTALDFGLPSTMADPRRLEQVFINLINNALQALATRPGPRRLTIESKHLPEERLLVLSFADNGPGIPEQIMNHIFDPFFSTKQVGEGTGLGLSICFGIISQHQGRIWAENSPNSGAVFYIELPVTAPPAEEALSEARPRGDRKAASPSLAAQLQILAVDDEPHLLQLLRRVLTQAGHTVEIATDGASALKKIRQHAYDLIICDMLMPDMLGSELYHKAAAKFPHLAAHFIFITGNIVDPDTRIFLDRSGLPWLAKPFLPADIERVIAQATTKANLDGPK